MFNLTFKILMLLTAAIMAAGPSRVVAQTNAASEFSCAARAGVDRFPTTVKFQVVSLDQLEASAAYRDRRSVTPASLKRIEIATQPKVAVFQAAGAIGVSGEAKILISKDALKFGEVGTILLINQSTRESVDYQCQKVATAAAALAAK